jgi:putative component of toxin-antitoxin plasmid stabilization module
MYTILHYLDANGKDHFQEWLDGLGDRAAKIAIIRRLARLESAFVGKTIILLTCGGTKPTQERDINSAIDKLHDSKARNG